MKYLIAIYFLLMISACSGYSKKAEIICPKVDLDGVIYCSIPFVEMQTNYINLDGTLIEVSGTLSVLGGGILLTLPNSTDYDVPDSVDSIRINTISGNQTYESLKQSHGKRVSVFGKFVAKNDSGEWPDLVAHAIEDAQIVDKPY